MDFSLIRGALKREFINFVEKRLEIKPESSLKLIQQKMQKQMYQFDKSIGEAFNMYLLYINLAKNNKNCNNDAMVSLKTKSDDSIENKAIGFFKKNTASIEIFFQEKLSTVFFPIHPACRNLSKLTRRELMQEVNRDTHQDKINVQIDYFILKIIICLNFFNKIFNLHKKLNLLN